MRRPLALFLIAFVQFGCQAVPEPGRPLQPLAVDGPPIVYREVVTRARVLAMNATEAFYVDAWADVERASAFLIETAVYLPRSAEIPADQQTSLAARSKSLKDAAQNLRESALARDEKKSNDALQKINMLVRELRTP